MSSRVGKCSHWATSSRPAAAAAAESLQSCLTLCDPIDSSPPGSPVPGILQARTLEWVAISFSHAWKWKVKVKLLSRARLLATPWTAAHQPPPSMGFSRQEYWSGVPLPSPWLSLIRIHLWVILEEGRTPDKTKATVSQRKTKKEGKKKERKEKKRRSSARWIRF